MNKVILMGRLTRDPDIRVSTGEGGSSFARYTLAVDRRFRRDNDQQTADFIPCVVFGRGVEFTEKYLHQGSKVVVTGRIQTGSYTNRDGVKVYTTDVVVEDQEFAESKGTAERSGSYQQNSYPQSAPAPAPVQEAPVQNTAPTADGFMNIPDGIEEELPFI